jgi:hypothetical protein
MIKPFDMDLLREKIEKAIEKQYLTRENAILAQQLREAHSKKSADDQKQPDPAGPGSAESRLEEQLKEARRILDQVAQTIEKAIMRMVLMSEARKIKRDDILKIRAILEKGWLDATYPSSEGKPRDE